MGAENGRGVWRGIRRLGLPALLAGVGMLTALATPASSPSPPPGPGLTLTGATYRLRLGQGDVVRVESPGGALYSTLPLISGAAGPLPRGAQTEVARVGQQVRVVVSQGDRVLEQAVLTLHAGFFTVAFAARPAAGGQPYFFGDGRHGIGLRALSAGWSPDGGLGDPLPMVRTAGRVALAPAPLEVAIRGPAGWLGLGLEQVPDATELAVTPGGILVNYPLRLLRRIHDSGAGGMEDGLLRFPDFVVVVAGDPLSTLADYRQALVALGAAPATLPARPAWWQEPIVDTWGAQMAAGAERGSPRYTAAWVRRLVALWQARYGLRRFTLVIDSRWQATIGSPEPDPIRFGGVRGMRRLIDQLHRQGIRVLLWWPLWDDHGTAVPDGRAQVLRMWRGRVVDPTAPGFPAAMARTLRVLLGTGPGCLDADGLKLDWQYDIPPRAENPALGWGAAALYRYLEVIADEARAIRPDALIDSSAAAPQFQPLIGAVRLYDAWNEQEWDRRAAVVATADPGVLIDGDDWRAGPADAVQHAVSSAVYGAPAFYFGDRWMGGIPIPTRTARALALIGQLAATKGMGTARPLAGGQEWQYRSHGLLVAQTFDGQHGLVVWQRAGCRATLCGTVVTTAAGLQAVPVPAGGIARLTGGGHQCSGRVRHGWFSARLEPDVVYRLAVA